MKISNLAISIAFFMPIAAFAECEINGGELDFGAFIGVEGFAQKHTSGMLNVRCENGVPFEIRPNANSFRIEGTSTVDIGIVTLYQDVNRSIPLAINDRITGTGTGNWQQIPVYSTIASRDSTHLLSAGRYSVNIEYSVVGFAQVVSPASIDVEAGCLISAPPQLSFGVLSTTTTFASVGAAPLPVNVTCGPGTQYQISADKDFYEIAGSQAMFVIKQPGNQDLTTTDTFGGTGSGLLQQVPLSVELHHVGYGRSASTLLDAGLAPGQYSETATIRVNW